MWEMIQIAVQCCYIMAANNDVSSHLHIFQYFVLQMVESVYTMRLYTPLWVGMLTFINPWMIVLMNGELRRMTFCNLNFNDRKLSSAVGPISKTAKDLAVKK